MCCMPQPLRDSFWFAVLKRVALYTAIVLLIAAVLAVLFRGPLLRFAAGSLGTVETTSFGQNTALIEHKRSCKGIVVERRIEQTRMSRLIARYLGPQGEETKWGLIKGSGPGFIADANFGPVADSADKLADVIESSMSDAAKRQCLSQFQQCLRDDDYMLSCDYVEQVIKAVGKLGRTAEAGDLPTLEDVRMRRQIEFGGWRY